MCVCVEEEEEAGMELGVAGGERESFTEYNKSFNHKY